MDVHFYFPRDVEDHRRHFLHAATQTTQYCECAVQWDFFLEDKL